ncbi:MAG: HEAT repeat domain-containing protein [Planctomycetaceae bacterium]|nr:HEAT repeat domain-containing protein [Planctomycetaceae bacterium]
MSFAGRRDLLTEDALLKRLYDQEPAIRESAEIVLTTRGLTADQIGLGKQIFSPKPELRAAVIPLLGQRTDIDPMVWLLQLSHDPVESVRIAAAEAMAERFTPEARQRLTEMAETDPSPAVRQAANQLKTAALPPLPGSTSLNPKAN